MTNKPLFALSLCAALALSSCVSDDTDFSDIIDPNKGDTIPAYTLPTVALDTTPLDETEGAIDATDENYVESYEGTDTIDITYNGSANATVSALPAGVRATVSGGYVTMRATPRHMVYRLQGNTAEGQFKLYSEHRCEVILNGVDITNPTGSAFNNQGKRAYIVLADGTANRFADGTAYSTPAGEKEKAAFYSRGSLLVSGAGSLRVEAKGKKAFVSDDYIVIRPHTNIYLESSADAGMKANDGIIITGGVLNINVTAQAAKGINCEANVTISGGRLRILTSGSTRVTAAGSVIDDETLAVADTSAAAAIKCDSTYTQTGGDVRLLSSGDGAKGINANMDVLVSGGNLVALATGQRTVRSPKGVNADGAIVIGAGATAFFYSANGKPIDAVGTIAYDPALNVQRPDTHAVIVTKGDE